MNLREKERFIPFRAADVVEMCVAQGGWQGQAEEQLRSFCRILKSVFHFEFHERLEMMKDLYSPFNPTRDTQMVRVLDADQREKIQVRFISELESTLDKANFETVSRSELEEALEQESLFFVKLQIDFDDFEDVVLYRRGMHRSRELVRPPFKLRKRWVEFDVYDRVVFYVRFKPDEYFAEQNRSKLLFEPGSSLLKLFRDVPKHDIEMLFPNTEVRMTRLDKMLFGIPAAAGGIVILITKLGASLVLISSLVLFWMGWHRDDPGILDQKQLLTLAGGLGALGAYLFRQWSKFRSRCIRFLKSLTDSLYFRNLDNNLGVVFRLVDNAEDEEFKESILAYCTLLASNSGLSAEKLDLEIETWMEKSWACAIDFEIQDAMEKLLRLGLVVETDGIYHAIAMEDGLRVLNKKWDGFFEYK